MMITGQKPIKSKQGQFQIVDVVQLFDPIVNDKQIVNGNTIPSITREAFRISEEEKPGPFCWSCLRILRQKQLNQLTLFHHERFYAVAGKQIIVKTALIRVQKTP